MFTARNFSCNFKTLLRVKNPNSSIDDTEVFTAQVASIIYSNPRQSIAVEVF